MFFFYDDAVAMNKSSDASVRSTVIDVDLSGLTFVLVGYTILKYLFMNSVPIKMISDNVSTTQFVVLVRRSQGIL